jgi:hypothetical protein
MWKGLVDIYLRCYEFCVFSWLIVTRLAASLEMFMNISCVEFCTYQTKIIEINSRIVLRSKVQHGIQCSSSQQTVSAGWQHVENLPTEFHLNRTDKCRN